MKKLVLSLVILTFTSFVYSQKIVKNEVDKFTKQQIVETSLETIIADNAKQVLNLLSSRGSSPIPTNTTRIGILQQGDNTYLRLIWNRSEYLSMREGAQVMFLDSDGNTYIFINAKSEFVESILDLYFVGDIDSLKDKTLTDIRYYTSDGYVDSALDKKASKKITALIDLFNKTVSRNTQQ